MLITLKAWFLAFVRTSTTLWKYRRLVRGAAILTLLGLVVFIWYGIQRPPRTIHLDPITTIIEVPVEKLTTKVVTEYVPVPDRAGVTQLMADNARLKSNVEQLTLSLAEATSKGSGPVTVVPPTPTPTDSGAVVNLPLHLTFKDWRLDFQSDGKTGTYTLHQQFSILNTVGRNADNTPVNIVRLYEIGKDGERLLIPTTSTTTIAVMPDQIHFYVKPTVQLGAAIFPYWETTTTPATVGGRTQYQTAVALTVPWLKRGTIEAVEYTRYAYLTPVVTLASGEQTAGVAPISINVGTFKYTPFSDIWFSPYVGVSTKQATKKFAIVFSTTF